METLFTLEDILRACETDHEHWDDVLFIIEEKCLVLETRWRNKELAGVWVIPYPVANRDAFSDLLIEYKVCRVKEGPDNHFEFAPGALAKLKAPP
jgi:hypothetical protein